MIEHIGSQTREPIEDTDYILKFRDEHLVLSASGVRRLEPGRDTVLLNKQAYRNCGRSGTTMPDM